ncbi:MAG: NUDIX domain-containing protein, partial [Thermodesulfobacteriota bacterium]
MGVVVKSRQTVFEAGVFKLETEHVTLENGVDTRIHLLRHPGASAIVPMLDPRTVVLISQYRHALGRFVWEVPAGTLHGLQEDPLECARRELLEETGYRGGRFEKLGAINPSPGYSDECIHVFLATDLAADRQNLDRDEVLRVHVTPFDQALEMARDGE